MKRRKFVSRLVQLGVLSYIAPKKVFAENGGKKDTWQIKQFKDKGLAHFSYAVLVNEKIWLVDPARDPQQYFQFAEENKATIAGIIETHPHADFISSHLEIYKKTGATIYTSGLTKPRYAFKKFDQGDTIELGAGIVFRSIDTPGHAPDGISAVLQVGGKDKAVFSGDSLLIGDVGRPDLREYNGDVQSKRLKLAAAMYTTVWQKFNVLDDDVILYPAHGAGSLCGKNMRDADSSTIGYEKANNYAFQKRSESEFVALILSNLPEIPAYFPYDVALNVNGAVSFEESIAKIKLLEDNFIPPAADIIVDARPEHIFKTSYINGAYNIPDGTKFETWLGSIVHPEKDFYLVAENATGLSALIHKAAKIGYENKIKGAFIYNIATGNRFALIDVDEFVKDYSKYTIIDVRSHKEFTENKLFDAAINIPVNELFKHIDEIPKNKPILVHCASGYRSAIGSSIIKKYLPAQQVFDLGDTVLTRNFKK